MPVKLKSSKLNGRRRWHGEEEQKSQRANDKHTRRSIALWPIAIYSCVPFLCVIINGANIGSDQCAHVPFVIRIPFHVFCSQLIFLSSQCVSLLLSVPFSAEHDFPLARTRTFFHSQNSSHHRLCNCNCNCVALFSFV